MPAGTWSWIPIKVHFGSWNPKIDHSKVQTDHSKINIENPLFQWKRVCKIVIVPSVIAFCYTLWRWEHCIRNEIFQMLITRLLVVLSISAGKGCFIDLQWRCPSNMNQFASTHILSKMTCGKIRAVTVGSAHTDSAADAWDLRGIRQPSKTCS